MHETPSRDRGYGLATGQPQGLGPEAYLFSTSQESRTPGRTARSAVAAGGSSIMRAKTPPERPDLALHYQWRDYAPLQTCPPPAGQTSLPQTTRSRLACPPGVEQPLKGNGSRRSAAPGHATAPIAAMPLEELPPGSRHAPPIGGRLQPARVGPRGAQAKDAAPP
jgi:hypothetical protein